MRLRTIVRRTRADLTGGMTLTSPLLRTTTLLGATLTMGLVAGVFALFAHTIMPGLHRTDDRTFVTAFQQMDRAIINPWFMIFGFGGALVFTAVEPDRFVPVDDEAGAPAKHSDQAQRRLVPDVQRPGRIHGATQQEGAPCARPVEQSGDRIHTQPI